MANIVGCLILLFFSGFCDAVNINLGGTWKLKDDNKKYVDLKANVPGGIYSDLMKNHVIDDIFYGYGDNTTKWVAKTNWIYYTDFTVENDITTYENANLVFEGLDTFADVFINDVKVGESQNMFVQYVFNVKDVIKAGANTIEVRFQSAIEKAAEKAEQQNKLYPIPLQCPPDAYKGDCHVNMIRKMQASFSWDWGPSFPSMGIWKDLYIEAYNESLIRYVAVDVVEKDADTWVLNIDTYFANNTKQHVTGKISYTIVLDTLQIVRVYDVDQQPNEYDEIVQTTAIEIPKLQVKTWWPNGYGSHDLYSLSVTYTDTNEIEKCTKVVRVGFKTVEVVQDQLDSGLTFYFKVNGIPIFMKGSNEIPINILPEKGQDKGTIKNILLSVQDAHMNMLRIWGGGVYESDYFYDLADELGILIWQDFMFACSLYPTNDDYLSNVIDEVRHQIKRIRSHPSIVIYSGNNENEGAIADNWYGIANNMTRYKEDYVKLYIETIKTEFDRLTHNRSIFISSSPTNGKESEQEGYIAKNPGNPLYGDVHFYNYILDPFDSNFYPVPRFSSEFGYQSLPSIDTLLTATNSTSDLDVRNQFLDYRQHHPAGNDEMKLLMVMNLKLPDESSANYYKAFIYYSQILHALSTKIETEHYRRYRSSLDEKGQGYTMGALYWQLNDVWVAPTWSGIDYTGRWKMLQYFARDFFAPIIITGHMNLERKLQIYAVSDLLEPVNNVTVHIKVFKWDSLAPINDSSFAVDLAAGKSDLIKTIDTDDFLSSLKCGSIGDAKNNCFFYLTMQKEGINVCPENYVFPGKLKDCSIPTPKLEIASVTQISDEGIYEIVVTTDQIALFVWLDSHDIKGTFSENGFVQVEAKRTVYFYNEGTTATDLQKALTITNLKDEEYFV